MRLIDADKMRDDWLENGENEYVYDTNAVLESIDAQPTVDAIPVTAEELKHLMNDTIAYIWRLEDRKCDRPEFGYDSRKELLKKLKKFYNEHFSEMDGVVNA